MDDLVITLEVISPEGVAYYWGIRDEKLRASFSVPREEWMDRIMSDGVELTIRSTNEVDFTVDPNDEESWNELRFQVEHLSDPI